MACLVQEAIGSIAGPVWGETVGVFPSKWPVMRTACPCHDVIMGHKRQNPRDVNIDISSAVPWEFIKNLEKNPHNLAANQHLDTA